MYYKSHPLSTTYFQTTYKTDNVCSDIIQPKTHEQLIEIIRTLNFRDQTYHVVSSGQNLGYGGRIPEENVDYLIDLQHLKNIHVDKQKAIATIQAGVTQTELFNHLVANDLEFFFHVSGAPADTSILGNALTGGYANGVNSIRFDRILALKGVYHDGTEFNTLTKSNTKYTDQVDLRGLFKNAENGIVTEIQYEIDPIPEHVQITFFAIDPDEEVEKVLDTLLYLRKNGVVHSNISIFNSYRIFAENTGHRTKAIDHNQEEYKQEIYKYLANNDLEFWSGEYNGVIANNYADLGILDATESYIKTKLEKYITKYKSVHVSKDDILRLRKDVFAPLPQVAQEGMRGRILTFTGIPKYGSVSMGYWRKQSVDYDNMELERDKCGFLWLAQNNWSVYPIPNQSSSISALGAYKLVRHPMYTALIFFFLPVALRANGTFSWIVYGVLVSTLVFKIIFEEKQLLKKHPEYADFRKATKKRLIPYIW